MAKGGIGSASAALIALTVGTLLCVAWPGLVQAQDRRLNPVHDAYPAPRVSLDDSAPEPVPDDSLAAAIADSYATNPELGAQRYALRASDDEVGIALALTRPQIDLQVSGGYDLTLPGDVTQAARPISDRLNNPNIERDEVTSQLVIDQPLFTGGRATGALRVAEAQSNAGRANLRAVEGNILVDVIAAYSDVRRDTRILALRARNLERLEATLDEIVARRKAGELTRTDIAQAETQLEIARVQLGGAEAQLETSRASFVALVGREPGVLAPEPKLPGLPASADDAFFLAEQNNPDLAAAIATQRAASERIAQVKAEGRPTLSLRGTAGTTGPALPFEPADQDIGFTARATLTIPLSAGGRIRAQTAQARNQESAERLRVEATRREMAQAIVNAWNQWVVSARNAEAQELQLRASAIFYEGTLAEYREGLRSTFDVLFAQNALNDAEIALLSSRRDSYVAQAVLLRRLGTLEADRLLAELPAYDPDIYLRRVRQRNALPWGPLVRGLDDLTAPDGPPQRLEPVEIAADPQSVPAPGSDGAPRELLRSGRDLPAGSLAAPAPNKAEPR